MKNAPKQRPAIFTRAFRPLLGVVHRGVEFQRRQGLRGFVLRLFSVWSWLPTVVTDQRSRRLAAWEAGHDFRVADIPLDESHPFGLNIAGFLGSEKGLGEAARSMDRASSSVGIPTALNNIRAPGARNREIAASRLEKTNPYLFNLICINGEEMRAFLGPQKGLEYFSGHYNIGLWHWELSRLPESWLQSFRYLNEVWVPTEFIRAAVASVAPVPVTKIPLCVVQSGAPSTVTRAELNLPEDDYVFLSVFDFHGVVERKNPNGLVEAYRQAFSSREPVSLILKCANSNLFPRERKELERATKGSNIRIVDKILTRQYLEALYRRTDCYVSLHRGEGFGLPIAEAMLAERPVIATGYSGNMDFMTEDNSYPVNYRLVPLARDYPPYKSGELWAEPDIEQAAALMRRVYENRGEAEAKGKTARTTIESLYSPAVVGQHIQARLEAVLTEVQSSIRSTSDV